VALRPPRDVVAGTRTRATGAFVAGPPATISLERVVTLLVRVGWRRNELHEVHHTEAGAQGGDQEPN
jgi:hypothetical protein